MVDVVQVRDAAYRITKVGTSGYDSNADFVAKANELNIDAMNMLTPHYGKIEALDDILNTFVKEIPATFTSGVLNIPNDFYGLIGLNKTITGNSIPLRKLKTNQLGAIGQNSIRKPTVAKPKYYLRDSKVVLLPSNGDPGVSILYFRLPAAVSITVSAVSGPDDDYEQVTAQTDYEWVPRVKNLLIYLMVQRLGGEMKEQILFEISQLGIQQNLTVNSAQ